MSRLARTGFTVLAALVVSALPAPAYADSPPTANASIIAGYVPDPSQWPWMTAVVANVTPPQDARGQLCGGTLIRPKVVVTAAHCIEREDVQDPSRIAVVLGRRDLNQRGGERIVVKEVVVHPAYAGKPTFRNDAAILHLTQASRSPVASLLAPSAPLREGQRATVMGWGLRELGNPASDSDVLFAADVPLWAPRRCASAVKVYDASKQVCAGYLNGTVDSCQNDSGGPLMVLDDATRAWKLLGIVSFGEGCALPGRPGVYAWVNSPTIRPFIDGEAAKDTTPPTADPPSNVGPTAPTLDADDKTPPRIGKVRLTAGGGRLSARFSVSEAAQVALAVVNRRTQRVVRGPLRRTARAGTNRLTIPRRLVPGRYVVVFTAFDAALNESTRAVAFRVRG